MTLPTTDALQHLENEHPEWKPWLAVLLEAIREAGERHWENFVPAITEPQPARVPLLSGKRFIIN